MGVLVAIVFIVTVLKEKVSGFHSELDKVETCSYVMLFSFRKVAAEARDCFFHQFKSDGRVVVLCINGDNGGIVGVDSQTLKLVFEVGGLDDGVGFVVDGIVVEDAFEAEVAKFGKC